MLLIHACWFDLANVSSKITPRVSKLVSAARRDSQWFCAGMNICLVTLFYPYNSSVKLRASLDVIRLIREVQRSSHDDQILRGISMLVKMIISLFALIILYCLGSGLFYLVLDKSQSDRVVKALSWRVGLSLSLFILLFIAYGLGWIHPHGV